MQRHKQGQAPYGYRWQGGQLVGDPGELQTKRRVFDLFVKLKSKEGVARELNASGLTAPRGGAWSGAQVGRLLKCECH